MSGRPESVPRFRRLPLESGRWPDALPLSLAPHLAALGLALGFAGWAEAHTRTIPSWIRWNYEGIERKPSYPLLRRLAAAVEGFRTVLLGVMDDDRHAHLSIEHPDRTRRAG